MMFIACSYTVRRRKLNQPWKTKKHHRSKASPNFPGDRYKLGWALDVPIVLTSADLINPK
ncbi:MAG: hypothetical protein Kow00121_27150 [Elainellaceae cyanobacterium]